MLFIFYALFFKKQPCEYLKSSKTHDDKSLFIVTVHNRVRHPKQINFALVRTMLAQLTGYDSAKSFLKRSFFVNHICFKRKNKQIVHVNFRMKKKYKIYTFHYQYTFYITRQAPYEEECTENYIMYVYTSFMGPFA